MSTSEGRENEQEHGPRGESLGTVRIPKVPVAAGGGGESMSGTRRDAQTQPVLVRPLPLVNSSTELRRSCGNVQGPGAENPTVGGTQMAPGRI